MQQYLRLEFIIPVIIFVVGMIFYLVMEKRTQRRFTKQTGSEEIIEQDEKHAVPARVCDNITGKVYNTDISPEIQAQVKKDFGTLGRVWDRDGRKCYGLNRYREVETGETRYRPIPIESGGIHTPTELYNDLSLPEIPIVYNAKPEKSFADKYGQLIWWVAVMGFIIFMMVSSMRH